MPFIIKSETKIATRKGCDIILQELENDRYATHCVQYAGNGKYFQSLEAAQNYIYKRWHIRLANPVTKEFHDELSNKVIAAFKNAVTATNNQQEAKAASTAIKR